MGPLNGVIIHEIINYSSSSILCNFVHEFRSLNFEAHNQVKRAIQLVIPLGVNRHV